MKHRQYNSHDHDDSDDPVNDWPLGPIDCFVGSRIRDLRKLLRKPVKEFACALGLTISQSYRIETGKRHLYPRELLVAAHFFRVLPIFFFEGYQQDPDDTRISAIPSPHDDENDPMPAYQHSLLQEPHSNLPQHILNHEADNPVSLQDQEDQYSKTKH